MLGIPGTLVHRLFLTPDQFLEVGVLQHLFVQPAIVEGIELLDADQDDVVDLLFAPCSEQIEIHFPGAGDHARDLLRVDLVDFTDDGLEGAVGQFLQRTGGVLVAQQRLRRHHHQRLALLAQHLPAQHVIDLRRIRGHTDFPVEIGGKLHVAFEAGGGMLRTLTFVTVRQQHHQAAAATPLGLAGGQELVDDDLGTVGEVAELRFPDHHLIGRRRGEAVFEGQHGFLGQHRVEAHEAALVLVDVLQRPVGTLVPLLAILVMQRGMAVEEGAASDVFTRDADVVAGGDQRGIG